MGRSGIRFRAKIVLLGGVWCFVLGASPEIVDRLGAARLATAFREQPGVAIGAVSLDVLGGRLALDAVSLTDRGVRLDIGHLDLPLRRWSGFALSTRAVAQSEATVSADSVRIEVGKTAFAIPHLKAEGTALSGEDLARIFDATQPGSLEERLAKLTARSITAPEVKILAADPEAAAKDGVFVVRNVALSDVVAGKIKALSAEGGSVVGASNPDFTATLDVGRIAAANLDVPLVVRIAKQARTDEAAPLTPIYDQLSVSAIKFTQTAPTRQSFDIGEIEAAGLMGRPLLVPIKDMTKRLDEAEHETSADEQKRTTTLLLDAMRSMSLGHFALHGVAYAGSDKDKPVGFKLATMSVDGGEMLRMGKILVDGVSLDTADVSMSFDRFAVEGLDQSAFADALKMSGSIAAFETDVLQHQAMRPNFSKVSLDKLRLQAPASGLDGNSADGAHYVFDIPSVTMNMAGITGQSVSAGSSHIQVVYDVAPTAPSPAMKGLLQGGFGHLDLSNDTAAAYDPDKQTFKLDRLSVAGKDLASLVIDGAASNVSADVFGPDKDVKLEALQKARLQSLQIAVSNQTLVQKILPILAAQSHMSVPVFKKDLKLKLQAGVLETLGDSPTAKQIVDAGTAFIDNPKNLTLKVEAPNGLGMQEVAGSAEPRDLLKLMTVTAKANQ